ncbi:argininosuccinate lyase, partial [Neisseria sp. P0016.S005]
AQAVRHADEAGVDLSELPLEVLQGFSDLIADDVYSVLTPEGSLNARNHLGGTAPEQVRFQVKRWRELLA